MKILAIGGCGEMGGYAVKSLIESKLCKHITVADINEQRAKEFANRFDHKVSWKRVDINDDRQLKNAMADMDIVMNTTGPYYKFGMKVLSAAIACRCHYIDICDDWEPTLEMFKLNKMAEEAGITAIIGVGASPGISNMLAVSAINELNEVGEIFTGWDLDAATPEKIGTQPSAATIHGIHQLSGEIKIFSGGEFINTKPLKKIKINYPGIPGISSAWTIGHPEAVTFPRYYSSLKRSCNVMTASRMNIIGIKCISWLVNRRLLSVWRAASIAERFHAPESSHIYIEKRINAMQRLYNRGKAFLPPLFAFVRGKKNGQPASCASMILSAPPGGMGGSTGIPLAVGVILLAKKLVNKKGVFAPEGIMNPTDFFNELAPRCRPVKQNINDLVLITRSWGKSLIKWENL